MAHLYSLKEIKNANEKYIHPYIRYLNFYLIVVLIASLLHYLGLRSWVVSCIVSYCTLKYVFSFIRQMDKYFHTNVTSVVEDNAMFYEGSFIADLQSAINIIETLLLPHFSKVMSLPLSDLVKGIISAVQGQKPIEYHGELIDLQAPIVKNMKHYSKMIVGAYGKKVTIKNSQESNQDILSSIEMYANPSMYDIQMGDEAYVEFLLDHCSLEVDDLIYCCFEGDTLSTESGVAFHSPPLFILRDMYSKSIVLLIRGTHNMNDIIVDIYGNNMAWEEGSVHEGMGLIAKWIATDNLIHSTLEEALNNNPEYSLKVVGHSLGAGIAALTTIYWKNNKTFRKHEKRTKNPMFLECYAYAPPPVLSKEIKEKGETFVYSMVNEDDVVPRLNVECIYGALNEIDRYIDVKKNDKDSLTQTKQKLRDSLKRIEAKRDHLHDTARLREASITSNRKHPFMEKMKEYGKKWEETHERKKDEKEKNALYGDFVLPGSIYLLHPFIGDDASYEAYEKAKSAMTTSITAVSSFFSSSIKPAPGIMHFPSEKEFPQIMRLSPFLTAHHNFRVYEESISTILKKVDYCICYKV